MIYERHTSEGFSAIELLITLFIATVFIISGYQLWSEVQTSGVASSQLSRASNVSYEYLRRYTSLPPTCTSSTPLSNSVISVSGLPNTKVTVQITCPYGASPTVPAVKQVVSTVTYGNSANPGSVSHAIYVD